jgi:hypothetical protein
MSFLLPSRGAKRTHDANDAQDEHEVTAGAEVDGAEDGEGEDGGGPYETASRRRMRKKRLLYRMRMRQKGTDDMSVPSQYEEKLAAMDAEKARRQKNRLKRRMHKLKRKQFEEGIADDGKAATTAAATDSNAPAVKDGGLARSESFSSRAIPSGVSGKHFYATDVEADTAGEETDADDQPSAAETGAGFFGFLKTAIRNPLAALWKRKKTQADESVETAQPDRKKSRGGTEAAAAAEPMVTALQEEMRRLREELNQLKSQVSTKGTAPAESEPSIDGIPCAPPAPDAPPAPPAPSTPLAPPPPSFSLAERRAAPGFNPADLFSVKLRRAESSSQAAAEDRGDFQITAELLGSVKLRKSASKTPRQSPAATSSPLISLAQLSAVRLKRTDADRSPGGTPRKKSIGGASKAAASNGDESSAFPLDQLREQLAKKFKRSPLVARNADNDDAADDSRIEKENQALPPAGGHVQSKHGQGLAAIPELIAGSTQAAPAMTHKRSKSKHLSDDRPFAPMTPISPCSSWESPYVPAGRKQPNKAAAIKNAQQNIHTLALRVIQ